MVRVTCVRNPFRPLESREIRDVEDGKTIRQIMGLIYPEGTNGYHVEVAVDGVRVADYASFDRMRPRPGSSVVFCSVPGGGEGKNPLAIVAMLAVMVLSYGVLGPSVAVNVAMMTGTTVSSTVASVAAIAGVIAGGIIVSAVFPKAQPDVPNTGSANNSPTYAWDTQNNTITEGGSIPELFGTCRVVPPIVSKYVETEGDKQYLNVLMAIAGHPISDVDACAKSLRINENNVFDPSTGAVLFSGIRRVDVTDGGVTQRLIQYFNDTKTDVSVGSKLNHSDWTQQTTTGNAITGFSITLGFPKGLYYARDDGGLVSQTVEVYIEFKKHTDSEWTPVQTYNESPIPVVLTQDRWSAGYHHQSGRWIELAQGTAVPGDHVEGDRYEAQPWIIIDDGNGDNPNPQRYDVYWRWIDYDVETVYGPGELLGNWVYVKAATVSPLHRSFKKDGLDPDQYDIRCKVVQEQETGFRYANEVWWESYQEIVPDDFIFPGTALLAVRALATDQFSGAVPRFDCIASRTEVPVFTGVAYAMKPADNPAWACYHMLHKALYKGTGDITLPASYEVMGVEAERIDYAAFMSWAAWCTDPSWTDDEGVVHHPGPYTVNIYFDQPMSLRKALDTVATNGRGCVVQLGSKFTTIVDRIEQTPVQRFMFTVGNIVADSFSEEWLSMMDRANAIEVTYFDAEQDYSRQTVTVYAQDYDTSDREMNPLQATLYGCVSRDMAVRYGKFLINSNKYLTLTCSFEADVDSIACIPGDVIEVGHDVPQWGYGGRIVGTGRNLLLYTEFLNTAPWSVHEITIEDGFVGPDGNNTAWKMKETATPATWFRLMHTAITMTAQVYTASWYVKAAERSWVKVMLFDGVNTHSAYFNLATGATGTASGGVTAAIAAQGDGWYRVSISVLCAATSIGVSFIDIELGDDPDATHNGVSGYGIYVCKPQLEPGSITDYVPNYDVALTGIILDREVTLYEGTDYAIMVKHQDDDSREEKTITNAPGTYSTLSISGSWTKTPELHALYSVGEVDHVVKPFRVLRITRSQEMRRKITCLEYVAEVYEDGATIPDPEDFSDLPSVIGLVATEVYRGGSTTNAYLKWRGIALFWNVFSRRVGVTETFTLLGPAYGPMYEVKGLDYGVAYEFAVSPTENADDGQKVTLTMRGKIDPPGDVPSITVTKQGHTVLIEWGAVTDFDLWGYELRVQIINEPYPYPNLVEDWTGATLLYKGNSRSYLWTYTPAGGYLFMVRAVDAFGNLSENSATYILTASVPKVPTLSCSFVGQNAVISWDAPETLYAIDYYSIYEGFPVDSIVLVTTTKSTSYSVFVNWSGLRRYWVRAVDVAGNLGEIGFVDATVISPGTITPLPPRVIDNNVLLQWTAPTTGSLPIARYEISKGDSYYTSEDVGSVTGTFSTVFESTSGTFTYWIVAVDTGGNKGQEVGVTATVNQPPDYVLVEDWKSTYSGTKVSAIVDGGVLYAPINITETIEDHFVDNSNDTPQEQIDAGYPLWIQPVPNSATYTEVFDYGVMIYEQTKISLEVTPAQVYGSATFTPSIEVSADGSSWGTPVESFTALESGFRYVRVILSITGSGNAAILRIDSLRVKLDLKMRTDAGRVQITSSGQQINFNVEFMDIRAITLTVEGTTALFAIYDFTDVPNPTHFHVYIFDAGGVDRSTVGHYVSWTARGV